MEMLQALAIILGTTVEKSCPVFVHRQYKVGEKDPDKEFLCLHADSDSTLQETYACKYRDTCRKAYDFKGVMG
ncbi:MAG: hypothetical protein AUK24_03595 [Syntrophaceae bacterium CG2_30_49_12]|nr:MAG: hypothetical protein AUK24_03595 [Syntrophaceae bacterium CG2_30_49_12]